MTAPNMQPSSATAPAIGLPLKYFLTGAFFYLFANFLVLIEADLLAQALFPALQVKALTHSLTLGFITMLIMGASYQLVPVILETKIWSERLGNIQYYIFTIGVVALICGFYFGLPAELAASTLFLCTAVAIFVTNILMTAKKAGTSNLTARYLKTGLFYLVTAVTLGTILAINIFTGYDISDTQRLLKAHVITAMLGFILMTLIGVSLKLIPMFALSHVKIGRTAEITYYLLNGAVVVLFFGLLMSIPVLVALGGATAFAALFTYFYQMYLSHAKRKRRNMDIGIRHSVSGVIHLIIGMVLGAGILFGWAAKPAHYTAFAYFSLFGFVAIFIVGQMHKIVPFLVWFAKYADKVGLEPVPNMVEMVDKRLGEISFWLLNAGTLLTGIGILIGNVELIRMSAALLLIGSVAFGANMLMIVRR